MTSPTASPKTTPAPGAGHPCTNCGVPNAAHPAESAETALCEGCIAGAMDFQMWQDGF